MKNVEGIICDKKYYKDIKEKGSREAERKRGVSVVCVDIRFGHYGLFEALYGCQYGYYGQGGWGE